MLSVFWSVFLLQSYYDVQIQRYILSSLIRIWFGKKSAPPISGTGMASLLAGAPRTPTGYGKTQLLFDLNQLITRAGRRCACSPISPRKAQRRRGTRSSH
jgi:hypothetical protein